MYMNLSGLSQLVGCVTDAAAFVLLPLIPPPPPPHRRNAPTLR